MNETVLVQIPGREYEIRIGPGCLREAGPALAALGCRGRTLVVTNPIVGRLYLAPLCDSLSQAGFAVHQANVPDGEEHKSLAQAALLYEEAIAGGLGRDDTILALGGGVIGDLAGFVAATYLRGVGLVQVPTTLLAQIDSGIGGKVAVNLPAGKNLVGAFHQPLLVLADTAALRTLPEREVRAGLVEMLKHGLLEAAYFDWYERHLPQLLARDETALGAGLAWSCRIKARIVAGDERESGPRMALNLGHTVGHALEAAAGYGVLRHGEAVGLGLLVAGRLALRFGRLTASELARLERAVRTTLGRLPALAPEQVDPVLRTLWHDKKIRAGRLQFVLPAGIGRVVFDDTMEAETIRRELLGLIAPEVV